MKSFLCGSEKVAANLLVLAWPNSKFTAQKLKYNNKTIFCVILLLSYIFQQKKQLTAILLCWTWKLMMQDTFCHSFLHCFSMTHSFIKTRTPTCNEQVLFLASKNLFTLPHTSTYICTISKNALETLHNNCLNILTNIPVRYCSTILSYYTLFTLLHISHF